MLVVSSHVSSFFDTVFFRLICFPESVSTLVRLFLVSVVPFQRTLRADSFWNANTQRRFYTMQLYIFKKQSTCRPPNALQGRLKEREREREREKGQRAFWF